MKHIFIFLLVAALSNTAAANDFNDCEVLDIRFGTQVENGHVYLSCKIETAPACASANQFVAFDKSTDLGKQQLSLFLTAFAGNFKVRGGIKQECATWQHNVALLTYVVLKNN